jgi:DNA-binding response OmpR family regulator
MLVSLVIEEVLTEHLCNLVGPHSRIDSALEAARSAAIDFAVLDVNINGTMVYPVAEELDRRQIPFIFLSGYGAGAIPAAHLDWRVCSKPFHGHALVTMMIEELNRKAPSGGPD